MPPLLVLRDRTLVHHCVFPKTVARCISYFLGQRHWRAVFCTLYFLVKDIGVPLPFQALFADKHRLSQIFPQTVFFWPCVSFGEGVIIKEDSAVDGLDI